MGMLGVRIPINKTEQKEYFGRSILLANILRGAWGLFRIGDGKCAGTVTRPLGPGVGQ